MAENSMGYLPSVSGVDDSMNWINARHQGIVDATMLQNNALADQKRQAFKDAGSQWANGDQDEATNALLRGGYLDEGNTLKKWMDSAKDHELEQASRDHAVISNMAGSATSEPTWNKGLDAYESIGGNVAKYRAIQQKFGWQAAQDFANTDLKEHGSALKAQQDRRAENQKTLGQIALSSKGDDDELVNGLLAAGRSGIPVAHLLQQGENGGYALAPGARALVEGQGGQGTTVFNADAKAQLVANRATKQSGEDAAVKKMQDEFASQNPDAKPLAYTQALSAHNALTSKFASGSVLKGWKIDGNGNAVEPIWGAPTGTAAELRARHTNPELQAQLAESKKAGSLAGQQDARASNAVGAMSHIDDAIEDFRSPGAEEAYGYLQANKIWQAVRSEADLKNVNVPSAYRNILQSKGIITQEAAKVFAGNNPQVTDAQRHEAAELLAGLEHAPNVETAVNQLLHLKRALSRIAAQPKPQAFINNPELEKARGAATERFLKDMSSAEEGRSLDPNLRGNTENKAPAPGAKLAPDGNWYLPDPNRPGKFLRVEK